MASVGIDGIETLGNGHKGCVSITRQYHQALEVSIVRNFPDNEYIFHMCHNTDGLYSAKQTTVIIQAYISSVTYNALLLGEFIQPDWDMFHNLHPAIECHGAARVVRGCANYISEIGALCQIVVTGIYSLNVFLSAPVMIFSFKSILQFQVKMIFRVGEGYFVYSKLKALAALNGMRMKNSNKLEIENSGVIEDSKEYCSDFMLQLGFMKLFIGLMLIKFAVI